MQEIRSRTQSFLARNFFVLGLVALAIGLANYGLKFFKTEQNFDAVVWNLSHLHMNYLQFGFIKRGLAGSVFAPVLALFKDGGAGEYLLLVTYDIALCILLIALIDRFLRTLSLAGKPGHWPLLLILLIAPTGFMQLGFDLGRYDHLNFLLVVLAISLVQNRRPTFAGLVMFFAVLNHEAVVVYGLPLVLAAAWYAYADAPKFRRNLLLTGFLPILAAALVLAFGQSTIDPASLLAENVSLASSVWSREIVEPSLFLRKHQYAIVLFYAAMPYLFVTWFYRANGLKPDLLYLAPFAALALFVLGVDYARWTSLILFACLSVMAIQFTNGHDKTDLLAPTYRKILFVAYILPLGPIGITHPLPYLFGILGI